MDVEEFSYTASLSPLISSFTLLVLMLLFSFTPVEGQPQVIGSVQPIVAAPGDDVILLCHVKPALNVTALTVEWSRPDLKPDPEDRLSRVKYVHFYRNTKDIPDMKISSFVNRTTLFKDGLARGNISLKITNVTLSDEGRFRCFIPKLESQVKSSIVRLVVGTNSYKTWTTETPLQPTSNQTLVLKGEMDVNGGLSGRSRWTIVVVFCFFFMILGVGVTRQKCRNF
ncbi:butyrophilin subfamily 3 member A2-like [Anarrhichthys ocellatus]|uniref:butyrophilin subfamily 3 member A2-like n=1 Tax=Anarrhichthys ocellatus TaxID=433405 RepID=UPI0012ED7820|nr:butyrophilin subfamily 3 member A2-like [Anarrhichthys ocellatus]